LVVELVKDVLEDLLLRPIAAVRRSKSTSTRRRRINAMLERRVSLGDIADELNAKNVPTIHGTNRWTAGSFGRRFVS